MANLLDYVRWRGDLTFAERPFNIVDNLVIAALSNVELADAVPVAGTGETTTMCAAAEAISSRLPGYRESQRLSFVPADLVEAMGNSARFRSARLSSYADFTDHSTGTQFAAVTVQLDDGTTYVSFRGTDATITGWREDFTMSFQVTESQKLAASYLKQRIEETPGRITVGGHSKGGNLALYAAMHQSEEDQAKIDRIYTNDGPGLSPELVDEFALGRVSSRITKVVPEFAVIGRIFDPAAPTHIVASSGRGLVQHDIMTWQVEGTSLREKPAQSPRADILNRAIDTWLEGANNGDRRHFTEALFDALSAGGSVLLQDIPGQGNGSFESVILSLIRNRTKTRNSIRIGIRAAKEALKSVDYFSLIKEGTTMRALAVTATGLLFISVPGLAIQVLGAFAATLMCFYLAVRLGWYFFRYRRRHRLKFGWTAVGILILALVVSRLSHISTLVVPMNLALSLALLGNAWASGRKALHMSYASSRRSPAAAFMGANAIISLLFAIVALATVDRSMPFYVFELGQYLLVLGISRVVLNMRTRAASQFSQTALERAVCTLTRQESAKTP